MKFDVSKAQKTINVLNGVSLVLYVFVMPFAIDNIFIKVIKYLSLAILLFVTIAYIIYVEKKITSALFVAGVVSSFLFFELPGTILFTQDYLGLIRVFGYSMTTVLFYHSAKMIKNIKVWIRLFLLAFFAFVLIVYFVNWNAVLGSILSGSQDIRIGSKLCNQNELGFFCSLSFSFCLYLILFLDKKIDYLFGIELLLVSILAYLTGSKTSILLIIISIAVLVIFKLTNIKIGFKALLISFVALLIVIILVFAPGIFRTRLIRMLSTVFGLGRPDTSILQRFVWFKYGVVVGSQNMIFGYGYDGFRVLTSTGVYSHSNYSEIIYCSGLLGFVCFYSIPFSFVVYPFILKRQPAQAQIRLVLLMGLLLLFASFSIVFYTNKLLYLVYGLCFCIVSNCKNDSNGTASLGLQKRLMQPYSGLRK